MVNTRRIELADGAVADIRGVEVARGIDRQAHWDVQIRGDIAEVITRRIELAYRVADAIHGVEVARGIERQAGYVGKIRGDIALVNTRRIELADGAGVGPISGVEIT